MKYENITEMLKVEREMEREKVCYEKEEHFPSSLDICLKHILSMGVERWNTSCNEVQKYK
jgi:hypothetical protein